MHCLGWGYFSIWEIRRGAHFMVFSVRFDALIEFPYCVCIVGSSLAYFELFVSGRSGSGLNA